VAHVDSIGSRLNDEPALDERPQVDDFGVLRHRGKWLSLTPTEESIMRFLIEHLGGPVARSQVAAVTWPRGGRDHHAINVHIHRLRPRLVELGLVIHTLRGRGFLLESLPAPS
jgi:two-component system, OmpR family, response regulator